MGKCFGVSDRQISRKASLTGGPLSTALVPGIVPWLTGAFPRSFLGHSSEDLALRRILSFDDLDGRRALSYLL